MKNTTKNLALRCLLATGLTPFLTTPVSAGPEDWQTPEALVHALYETISGDAGEQRDLERYRALFLDGARLSLAMDSKIGSGIMGLSSEELIVQTESAYAASGFHETALVTRVEQYGLLASVMSSFEVRLRSSDEQPLMRGLNHFQLLNDGERWWIVSNIGTIETLDEPLPPAFEAPTAKGAAQ
jgi:hypothetical protein